MSPRIEPQQVIQNVEQYIESELDAAARYDNREPLDSSGAYSLHRLAAEIYAAGWADGERAEAERSREQRRRDRDAEVGPVTPEDPE